MRPVASIALAAWRARFRRATYRIAIAIAVFGPILATFFGIWRLWGNLIGGTEFALFGRKAGGALTFGDGKLSMRNVLVPTGLRLLPSKETRVRLLLGAVAAILGGLALVTAAGAGSGGSRADAFSVVTLKCPRGQTPAVVAGRRTCLYVGKRCKTAQDRLYHRYGFHCVKGRLARRHPTPPPSPQPQHAIGVRVVNGAGEFYLRATNEKFIPRGNNFLRRADQLFVGGSHMIFQSTFIVGRYDATAAEAALRAMHEEGYNVVRVFLDPNCQQGCLGDPATHSLSSAYVANVVDFLKRAKANGIYVMLIADGPPWVTPYNDLIPTNETFSDWNTLYLSPGGVEGSRQFWQALIRLLLRQGAPLDAIWAYSLGNEAHFTATAPPLSLTSGLVTTANGKSYDMASVSETVHMLDDGLVYSLDQVRAAIRQVDPTALVTAGFFQPQQPNPTRRGDPRYIRTGPVITQSQLDFVDLHLYPGLELSLPQYVQNFELPAQTAKPVVMGEFGAFQRPYPTVSQAAEALRAWQIESCRYGFDGWLFWTWDTTEAAEGEPPLWNALSDGGVIAQALAPKNRPDPCG
jgi:hypothetical protein